MYKKLTVGSLQTNCYLYYLKNKNCIIIDPGDDAEYIIDSIQKYELKPVAIVATHGHFDHLLSVSQLKETFNIPFLISKKDVFLVSSMRDRAKHWLSRKIFEINPSVDGYLLDKLEIEGFKISVLSTPGHTPGSVCLYDKDQNILFTGDLIFSDGNIGRYDFSYSNKLDLENSIQLILQLQNETKVCPGHGEETSIKKEKEFHKGN